MATWKNVHERRSSLLYALVIAAWIYLGVTGHSDALGRVTFALLAAVLLMIAVRAWRSRLVIEDETLSSFGPYRTRRLSWSDISRISYRGIIRGLSAELRSGSWESLQRVPPRSKHL